MAVTITLHEPLASRLQAQALAHQLPLEDYALRILGEAVNGFSDPQWQACNQRRVALIRKRFAGGLSPEEAGELQQLQRLADQKLEALDQERLTDLRRLRDQVGQVLSRPAN